MAQVGGEREDVQRVGVDVLVGGVEIPLHRGRHQTEDQRGHGGDHAHAELHGILVRARNVMRREAFRREHRRERTAEHADEGKHRYKERIHLA